MDPKTILQQEDCEIARTPGELLTWTKTVYDRFGVDEETINYARMAKGLSKPFFEEIMPLAHLARHKYLGRTGLYLRPKIGNQNYDAEIIEKSSGMDRIHRLEFMSASESYESALRMEYLIEKGWVPLSGPISRIGEKASGGKVVVARKCENPQQLIDDLIARIDERISQKLQMPYVNTIIAIVLGDNQLYPHHDLSRLEKYFADALRVRALTLFSGLFIIGISGRRVWEFGENLP